MSLPEKNAWLGLIIGALSATAVAVVGPGMVTGAFADEAVTALDAANLVKFEDRTYSVTYEDSISTEPLSQSTVRKIGYGRTSFVTIARTQTGTYSSEALYSPHIRYPGIHVKRAPDADPQWFGALSFWSAGRGWVAMPLVSGGSIVNVRTGSGRVIVNDGAICTLTQLYSSCD